MTYINKCSKMNSLDIPQKVVSAPNISLAIATPNMAHINFLDASSLGALDFFDVLGPQAAITCAELVKQLSIV
jgi:hypothetical protein